MKTLYIDVYFLINFVVDLLSLYFASLFSKTPTTTRRLIASSTIGAVIAVLTVFLPENFFIKIAFSFIGLFAMGYVAPKPMKAKRKVKFIFSFLIFNSLRSASRGAIVCPAFRWPSAAWSPTVGSQRGSYSAAATP